MIKTGEIAKSPKCKQNEFLLRGIKSWPGQRIIPALENFPTTGGRGYVQNRQYCLLPPLFRRCAGTCKYDTK